MEECASQQMYKCSFRHKRGSTCTITIHHHCNARESGLTQQMVSRVSMDRSYSHNQGLLVLYWRQPVQDIRIAIVWVSQDCNPTHLCITVSMVICCLKCAVDLSCRGMLTTWQLRGLTLWTTPTFWIARRASWASSTRAAACLLLTMV